MELRVLDSPSDVAAAAADLVAEAASLTQALRLGVATGRTTEPLHSALVERAKDGRLQVDGLSVFLLDEYLGLPEGDPRRFAATIQSQLIEPMGLPSSALHGPDTSAEDIAEACADYDRLRDEGGIDLQILGIGRNGHIAFNEPGSPPDSECRVVELALETRADNGLGAGDPHRAMTVGIASILRARQLVLLATGPAKAEALAGAVVQGNSTVPAAALLDHQALTVLADSEAAALLPPAMIAR